MTTRSRQKLSSILAVFSIIAVLLLLIFVWTAVRNGVFSNTNDMNAHGSYRLRPINPNELNDPKATPITTEHSTIQHSHGHHAHHHHHQLHNESTTSNGKLPDIFITFRFFLLLFLLLNFFQNVYGSTVNVVSSARFRDVWTVLNTVAITKNVIPYALHMVFWHNSIGSKVNQF